MHRRFEFFFLYVFNLQFRTMKRIGGAWNRRAVDGDKFICMDRVISGSPCNIYSFGVDKDWTFEDYMDSQHGCSVWAYDHTVHFPAKRGKNINFFKLGLGIGQNLDTLANIVQRNGHNSSVIEYLKVRISHSKYAGPCKISSD